MTTTLLDAALSYAARGWPVLPLRGKIPLSPHGVKDATTDPEIIRAWLARWPTCNIGIACGEVSGLLVVDVDARSGGLETIAGYDLPPTLTVQTGGGGLHLYYQRPTVEVMGGKGRFGAGVDCQHDGRYVVAPPSIHPETHEPYRWASEDAPEPFPSLLVDVANRPRGVPLPLMRAQEAPARLDVEDRARRYVDTMRESISGKGGHDSLFRVACALVNGFDLPIASARRIVDDYNATKAAPPWSDKEIAHKLDDAAKDGTFNGRSRGCLLSVRDADRSDPVPVAAIVKADRARRAVQASREAPASVLSPPGIVGEVMRWIEACSVYSAPLLSLAAAISVTATICGRRYRTESGIRPVLYLVGVAKSGVGKETGRQCAISLLRSSGLGSRVGADEVSSAAALTSMMREHPIRLQLFDELGRLLEAYTGKGAASFERQIVTTAMRLWSCADGVFLGKAMADQKEQPSITMPHMNLYGTTTPGSLHRSLRGTDVTDGVLNRLILIHVDQEQAKKRRPTARKTEPPEMLIMQAKALSKGPEGQGDLAGTEVAPAAEVGMTTEAWEVDESIGDYARGAMEADDEHRDLWTRVQEQTQRIALVIAVGCGELTITADHMRWAWELVRWSVTRSRDMVVEHMSEGPEDAARQAILRRLDQGPASRNALTRLLWRVDKRTREAALATVLDSGRAVCESVASAGRTAQVYRLATTTEPDFSVQTPPEGSDT